MIERLRGERGPFVIAEAGVNHNGDAAMARDLVQAAARAGADAVKFQTFDPETLAGAEAPKAEYQVRATGADESQREMLRRLVLPADAYRGLKRDAEALGLVFLSTPFDEASADFLEALGVVTFKVPSGELTNDALLMHLARKGKPLIVSTGMSDLDEVGHAVAVMRAAGATDVILLHCVSSYPAPAADVNLRAMETLRARFGVPVGYSDHTLGTDVAIAAAALGATVIEKHLTLNHALPGPDHAASLEPDAFAAMVASIRAVHAALGDGIKRVQACERDVRLVARKSLHAARSIDAGALLEAEDVTACRPGTGLPPSRLTSLVGRRAVRTIQKGAILAEIDFD